MTLKEQNVASILRLSCNFVTKGLTAKGLIDKTPKGTGKGKGKGKQDDDRVFFAQRQPTRVVSVESNGIWIIIHRAGHAMVQQAFVEVCMSEVRNL